MSKKIAFIYALGSDASSTTKPSERRRHYYSTKHKARDRNPLYNKRASQLLKKIGGMKLDGGIK